MALLTLTVVACLLWLLTPPRCVRWPACRPTTLALRTVLTYYGLAQVRALAIMSHQLMSADLPLDDPATTDFVSAVFDAAALPQLLSVLAAG